MIKTLMLAAAISTSICAAEIMPGSYVEISPELSYGCQDNGPAWIELVPVRGGVQIDENTAIKMGMSYSYEIPRAQKLFGTPNHYGWRVSGRLEHVINGDARLFYEVNIAQKVDGALEDINFIQTHGYQRVGIIWRAWRIL